MNELIEAALQRTANKIVPQSGFMADAYREKVIAIMRRELIESGVLIPSEEINAR